MLKRKAVVHKTLVELDALLDTRIGTVDVIDSKLSSKLALHPNYHDRYHDDFSKLVPEIDMEVYGERYAHRDVEVLKHSVMSELSLVLFDLHHRYRTQNEVPLDKTECNVYVNYYPYNLSDSAKDVFANMVLSRTGADFVKLVSLPPNYINPQTASNYDLLIFYDFDEWLKLQADALSANRLNRTQIYSGLQFKKELDNINKQSLIVHKNGAEQGLLNLFNLILVPLSTYSFNRPSSLKDPS